MKIAAVFCLMAGSAAAFAPQQQVTKTSALSDNKFAGELGAQKPLGFWDPLNFLLDEDQAAFDKLRAAEIKHGRVAMLAVTGHLVTSGTFSTNLHCPVYFLRCSRLIILLESWLPPSW
jgi:hypothetical protein